MKNIKKQKFNKERVTPFYKHDCENCKFLGVYDLGGNKIDLYLCIKNKEKFLNWNDLDASLVCRRGNDGYDYQSYSLDEFKKNIESFKSRLSDTSRVDKKDKNWYIKHMFDSHARFGFYLEESHWFFRCFVLSKRYIEGLIKYREKKRRRYVRKEMNALKEMVKHLKGLKANSRNVL